MKKLSTYLFLILFGFSAPSFADDITDFQIEGMSIGDSLLDYFSEDEIRNNIGDVYSHFEDKTFVMAAFGKEFFPFKTYDVLQIAFKDKDKDYKIYGIAGKLLFYENINDCYVKQNEILNELSTLLKDTDKVSETLTHSVDSTGRSKIKSITWWLKSEDLISLDCYDWHEDMPYIDNLKVAADTKEFNDWLVEWQ
jgi:hypothetical protein